MTRPTTDDTRPTDSIRDAFEAMIAFLTILIGGPMPRAWPEVAAVAARAIGSQARTTDEADRAVAALVNFRDLVLRAAEEHNRRAMLTPTEEAEIIASAPGQIGPGLTPIGDADMPAERLREMRERCARATPGPWPSEAGWNNAGMPSRTWKVPGRNDGLEIEMLATDALFVEHAREDLPAALAWGERLAGEIEAVNIALRTVGFQADGAEATVDVFRRAWMWCVETGQKQATALKAEIERRGSRNGVLQGLVNTLSPANDRLRAEIERLTAELAARGPGDASLEARALDALRALVSQYVKNKGTESQFIACWTPPGTPECWARAIEIVDEPVVRAVDASRPGLTEEQARRMARNAIRTLTTTADVERVTSAILRASRGETGAAAVDPPTPDRPAGLTAAMHAAQQRPSVPPTFDDVARKMPGATCGEVIAELDARRATLHAGDPASVPARPGADQ